jgi:glycine cleavage system aminomethyltransferase T/glycine/D-amino acid oxidase-like deaminating enzyme
VTEPNRVPERARVVVIGGGIAGASVLHHLARLGWTDSVLVEKAYLTSGSTWHAAGLCTQFNDSLPLMRVLMRSLRLYDELGAETDHGVGLKRVGSVRLATTEDELDQLKARGDTARAAGLPYELIGPDEVRDLFPLADTGRIRAAAYLPSDGYVDPTLATQALAEAAQREGSTVLQRTEVTATTEIDGGWRVHTNRGEIDCEFVVNAAGQWAPRVARQAGIDLPIVALQHQYVVTEQLEEVGALERELPVLRDPEHSYYVRQEGGALLVGPFERNPPPFAPEGVPNDFEGRLLPGNLDQIMDVLLGAAKRVPLLADAGLKTVVNGPDGYTPDGHCLMGEAAGRRGYYVLAGFSIFGIVFGGGAGAHLAEWIAEGQPSEDLWELDVRRFGPYASPVSFVLSRATEVYEREYAVHYPLEEYVSARPLKVDPLHETLRSRGGVFGERFGWERPLWFSRSPEPPAEPYSFRRPAWHDDVGHECRAVRESVGVLDQTSFAKYELRGPGAAALLERLCANHLPKQPGSIVLTQMLTPKGGIECDVTVTWLEEDRYYVVSAAAAEDHDLNWIARHLPHDGSVVLSNVSAAVGVLTIAGPSSRALIERITTADVSADAFPFFRTREIEVGPVRARALRLSYTGELGFELHHPIELSRRLYNEVREAGRDLGLTDFGYHALESLRLEKGYRLWGADICQQDTPLEAGLGFFVDWEGDFIGRDALLAQRENGVQRRLVNLHCDGELPGLPIPHQPVFADDELVGSIRVGGYGHTIDETIALAYLPTDVVEGDARIELGVQGERYPMEMTGQALYDPENRRVRG